MAKGGGKKSAKAQRDAANKLLADNRFARHQYEILETLECGLELFGTEVKSIRAGQCNPVSYTHLTLPTKRIV